MKMLQLSVAALAAAVFASCGSSAGMTLTPSSGFLDRTYEVKIATTGMMFTTATPTVDFDDPAVTVIKSIVQSDNDLLLTVHVAASARTGAHIVTVNSGIEHRKLASGWSVQAELTAEPQTPPPSGPQGGIVPFVVNNQEYQVNGLANHFFPSFLLGGGLTQPLKIINVGGYTEARYDGFALIDPLALTGPLAGTITGYDPYAKPITFYLDPTDPALPVATKRAPQPISPGVAIPGQTLPTQGSTNFYTFTTTASNQVMIVDYSKLAPSFTMMPVNRIWGALAPGSGKFADGQPLSAVRYPLGGVVLEAAVAILPAAGTYYLSTYTSSGVPITYDALLTLQSGTPFSALEPMVPDSPTMPLATLSPLSVGSAAFALDGAIDSASDADFIRYSVPAAAKEIFISVNSPALAEMMLTSFSDAACTSVTAGGDTINSQVQTAYDKPAAGALTRCISVSGYAAAYPVPYSVSIAVR